MYKTPNSADHNSYYQKYVDLIDGDIFLCLERQADQLFEMLENLQESDFDYRYAAGKWSLKESLIHLIDTEQIFAYRALCISRGEKKDLPGFDQDAYVEENDFSHICKEDLIREFLSERKATISMFRTFNEAQRTRIGSANGSPLRVNSVPYIIAGHTAHHIKLFISKYLVA